MIDLVTIRRKTVKGTEFLGLSLLGQVVMAGVSEITSFRQRHNPGVEISCADT